MKSNRLNEAVILDQIDGQYEKFLMLVIRKYAPAGVVITLADLQAAADVQAGADPLVLFTHGHKDSIEFKVIRMSDAERIAAHADGQTKQGKPS